MAIVIFVISVYVFFWEERYENTSSFPPKGRRTTFTCYVKPQAPINQKHRSVFIHPYPLVNDQNRSSITDTIIVYYVLSKTLRNAVHTSYYNQAHAPPSHEILALFLLLRVLSLLFNHLWEKSHLHRNHIFTLIQKQEKSTNSFIFH